MSSPKLKPTAGYLLILPEEALKKTASGIVLPDTHEEKPQRGKVLAVGAAETNDHGVARKSPCAVGDVVYYKKWGGNEVKIDAVEYMLIKFEDIMALEA